MYLLLMLTCIAYFRFCSSNYEYLCPTALNWRIRSIALCTISEKYSCLRDANKDTSREICRETPSMLAPGNKYVIRGNLDGENCNGNRYQPFIFQTSKNNECAIRKSTCNEAGQIMYSNGSTTEDKSCRCDYSRSYAPIQKPSKPCYCVPSKEDCSCYLKLCPEKTHLSSGYTCVSDFTLMTLDSCGPISLSGSDASNMKRVIERSENTDKVKTERFDELLLVALMIVLAGFLLVAIPCIILGKFLNDDNKDESIPIDSSFQNASKSYSSDLCKTSTIKMPNVVNECFLPDFKGYDSSTEGEQKQYDEDIDDNVMKIVNHLQERTKSANEKEKGLSNIVIVLVSGLKTAKDKKKGNVDDKKKKYGSSSSLQLFNGGSKVESHADGEKKQYGSDSNLNSISDEAINKNFQANVKLYIDKKEEHNSITDKEEGNAAGKMKRHVSGSNINAHNNEKVNDSHAEGQKKQYGSDSNLNFTDDEAKNKSEQASVKMIKLLLEENEKVNSENDREKGDDEDQSVISVADDEEDQCESESNTSVITQVFDRVVGTPLKHVKNLTNFVAQILYSPFKGKKQDGDEKSNESDSNT